MFERYKIRKINKKILKISDVINKQEKKIRKLEDKKMKIEIAGGTLKKVDNKQAQPPAQSTTTSSALDENNPFNKLLSKQGLQPQMGESTQIQQPNPMFEQTRQQMMQEEQINQIRQQMMQEEQMKQQLAQEQYRQQLLQQQMMQQQMLQQQQMMQQPPLMQPAMPQQPSGREARITVYLTERESLPVIAIPLEELPSVEEKLDSAIVEQTAFKVSGITINGLYIKRYKVDVV